MILLLILTGIVGTGFSVYCLAVAITERGELSVDRVILILVSILIAAVSFVALNVAMDMAGWQLPDN